MSRLQRWGVVALALGAWLPAPVDAGDLNALVRDQKDQPVEDAVVVVTVEGAPAPLRPGRDTVDQIDKEFVPHVKPVVVGTAVSFPNKDNIRHHVYSFSTAKVFELPLYAGTPAHPVVFDRAGVVTIGCNIHDWMIAHVYVAESPYHGKTDRRGRVALANLPAGRHTVRVWHPRMNGAEATTRRSATLEASGAAELTWKLTLNPELRPRRSPVPGQRGYR